MACLFLDIKSAYNPADLNILAGKMFSLWIGNKASSNIVDIYIARKIYIRDQNNSLHGRRLVTHGLPQEAVLSPILFNMYTYDIHQPVNDNCTCIQYADALCFGIIQDSYKLYITELKFTMY